MRRFLPVLALMACSESEVNFTPTTPTAVEPGSVSGQVCDVATQTWLDGATVYAHIYDADGIAYDTRLDVTDSLGKWELAGLPGDLDYEVYIQHRNQIVSQFTVTIPQNEHVEIPADTCGGDVDLAVAVVSGGFDDLSVLFSALGIANYKEVDGQVGDELVQFLSDPLNLAQYQVIFFDGGHQEDGIFYSAQGDPNVDLVRQSLTDYVNSGGTVFASDWSYDVIESVWPDEIDFLGDDLVPDDAQKGESGTITALVADPGIVSALSVGQVEINYELAVWPLIEGVSDNTTIHIAGDAPWRDGTEVNWVAQSPLLVSFEQGGGRVVFTTYRNSTNGAGDMLEVLRFMLGDLSP